MVDLFWYDVEWQSARWSVVHSDGGPYSSREAVMAAVAEVKAQVLKKSGRVLGHRVWKTEGPDDELKRRAELGVPY